MYLREIHIDGLKLLRNFKLDFTRDGHPRMWTVLVGRNGLCKTSVLRAIALAASGQDLANELSSEQRQSFWDLRRPSTPTTIRASFGFGEIGRHWKRAFPSLPPGDQPTSLESTLTLAPGSRSFIGASRYVSDAAIGAPPSGVHEHATDPLAEARRGSLAHWFVAGYGVQRMLPAAAASKSMDDPVRMRLETLFDTGGLISTNFADHLAKRFGDTSGFASALHRALFKEEQLLPNVAGFGLRGNGNGSSDRLINSHRFDMKVGDATMRFPATWLSHGYQAILAWLADLVGHVLWEARAEGRADPLVPDQMEGLVLVDELDLHLHPAWQVGLITALKQTMPRMQFVVTTHSPMLLSGLEPDEVVVLEQEPHTGDVMARSEPATLKLQTSGELLERYFEVDELDPTQLTAKFRRFGFLANNPYRSDAEEAEMQQLLQALTNAGVAPEWRPVPRNSP